MPMKRKLQAKERMASMKRVNGRCDCCARASSSMGAVGVMAWGMMRGGGGNDNLRSCGGGGVALGCGDCGAGVPPASYFEAAETAAPQRGVTLDWGAKPQ